MGRILGMSFLPFESATLMALPLPPAHDSETVCHESKAGPTSSLLAAGTPGLLDSNSDSIPPALVTFFAHSRRISSPDLGELYDAGKTSSNRYFVIPDLIGSLSEMPIELWPSVVDGLRLQLRF